METCSTPLSFARKMEKPMAGVRKHRNSKSFLSCKTLPPPESNDGSAGESLCIPHVRNLLNIGFSLFFVFV